MSNNNNSEKGNIYIIFNDMFNYHGPDVYKIGRINNINKRMNGYTTSYIDKTKLIFLGKSVKIVF